jgi:hypothetical protein
VSGTPWYIINCLNGNDSNDGKSSLTATAAPQVSRPQVSGT